VHLLVKVQNILV